MNLFHQMNLPTPILSALEAMGYQQPTPVQAASIPAALAGKDLVASAQTGSGKTASFGIPLVVHLMNDQRATALVLAPTRELALQITEVLEKLAGKLPALRVATVIGGVPINRQRHALRSAPRILVATPGRLVDHLKLQPDLLAATRFLVLDEADRMLDMGFAAALREVRRALTLKPQTLLFSATFPTDIETLAREWLSAPERVTVGSVSRPVETIEQCIREVPADQKNQAMLTELSEREGSVLVFARTKRRTDRLAKFLRQQGHAASLIHGDRSQNQREQALSGFREGRYRILVATDIAARGIDVPHIAHVINFDLPLAADDYLHRIGRTGRAGRGGRSLCLVAPEEQDLWRAIERLMKSKGGLSHSEGRDARDSSLSPSRRAAPPKRRAVSAAERCGQSSGSACPKQEEHWPARSRSAGEPLSGSQRAASQPRNGFQKGSSGRSLTSYRSPVRSDRSWSRSDDYRR